MKQGLSRVHLAELCDVSERTLQHIEGGRDMRLGIALRLKKCLGLSCVEDLIKPISEEENEEWEKLKEKRVWEKRFNAKRLINGRHDSL